MALEGKIAALAQSRNTVSLEYLRTLENINRENVKQLQDAERSVVDAQDLNDSETLRFRLLDLVKSRYEEIIKLQTEIKGVRELLKTETDTDVIKSLTRQLELLERRSFLFEKEIVTRQRLAQLQSLENLVGDLRNQLASKEAKIGLEVATGKKAERTALIEATAERIKYKEALLEAIEAEQTLIDAASSFPEENLANAQRRDNIAKLRQELAELKTVIDDRELLSASNSIKDNFTSLFDSLQDGTKSASESFADLGRSILGTFRSLISKRLVDELFGSLFPTPGQTEGKVTGVFGKIFEKLGLSTASEDQKKAEILAKDPKIGATLDLKQRDLLDTLKVTVQEGNLSVKENIKLITDNIETEGKAFADALVKIRKRLEDSGLVLQERSPNAAKQEAKDIISKRDRVGSTASEDALKSPELTTEAPTPVVVKGIELDGTDKGTIKTVSAAAQAAGTAVQGSTTAPLTETFKPEAQAGGDIKAVADRIISAVQSSSAKLVSEISAASYRTQAVNIVSSGNILPTISSYFSALNLNISTVLGVKLDEIIRLLDTAGSVSSSSSPLELFGGEGEYRGGLIKRAYGGLAGFISGGAIKSSGKLRDDSIPARLSNGEYVVQAPVVKSLGERFFDYVNSTGLVPEMARGGALFTNYNRPDYVAPTIDPTKFNYTGGGASLLKKPDPIVEPPPPKPKKVSKFRKFLGGALSFVAPFLRFIPGIGPLLSLGAGIAGGALSGNGLKDSILGGVVGGLSNLGGFANSDTKFGKFASFFSSGNGKALTGLLSASSKNTGNQAGVLGQSTLSIFQNLFKKNRASGGIVSMAGGGFLDSIGSGFSKIFSKLGGSGGSSSGGSGKGLDKLLLLFGLSSALGSLGGGGQQSEFQEVIVEDPDAERKNKFGSAYQPLIDQGLIPDFKYRDDTREKLIRQQEGLRNLVRLPKQSGILKFLTGILPFVSSLLGSLGKSGSNKGIVDSPLKFGSNPLGNVNAASGGLIKMLAGGGSVVGAGTSTSDSIPALLSNGEYVIKASSVRMLGPDILDSINSGRFKFADGGLVAPGVASIPESNPNGLSPNVNVDGRVKIINLLDPALLGDYLRTSDGQKLIVNTIGKNKMAVKQQIR